MKTAISWTKWAAECAAVACIAPVCCLLGVAWAFPKRPVKDVREPGKI